MSSRAMSSCRNLQARNARRCCSCSWLGGTAETGACRAASSDPAEGRQTARLAGAPDQSRNGRRSATGVGSDGHRQVQGGTQLFRERTDGRDIRCAEAEARVGFKRRQQLQRTQ